MCGRGCMTRLLSSSPLVSISLGFLFPNNKVYTSCVPPEMGNLSLGHVLHTSLISCYMVSKSAKEYAKFSEQTEIKFHIVSILSPALCMEIQFRRNNSISRRIFFPQYTFIFRHKKIVPAMKTEENKTTATKKTPRKISYEQLPCCVKNKQTSKKLDLDAVVISFLFPAIFADFFLLFNNDLWGWAGGLEHWMTS